jgi:DNA-binding CsgD family transcriptional regulator
MGLQQTILSLISLIYDAVPDASRWHCFLEAFVRATESDRGTLVLSCSEPGNWSAVCWYGWKEEEMRTYAQRYAAIDPWGSQHIPEGEIRLSTDLCSQAELEQSTVYREFYGPLGVDYGFGGVILRTDSGASGICGQRGNSQGPYGEREISILRLLMPHLRRAALLHGEFASTRAQLATFAGHLDRYPHPFLLADAECRLLYANAAAREIVTRRDGLTITDGRITLHASGQRKFQEAILEITKGHGLPVRHLEARHTSDKAPYQLLVMSVPNLGALPLGTSQPAAAVLVMNGESVLELDAAILHELFALTPAEARVTGRLVLGRRVQEIAHESGVSIETVRSQVRSILSKTNTGRQGELISLVLRMMPFRRV